MTRHFAPGQAHFAFIQAVTPWWEPTVKGRKQKPIRRIHGPVGELPAPDPKPGGNLGRRGVKAATEARSRWVAYYSPLFQAMSKQKLAKELAKKPEEQDKDKIKFLEDMCRFTPYVRTEPKIRHQRGMLRRLAKQFKADPPRVDTGVISGPE